MTTRDEFEKWAFQHELLLNESCVHQGLSVLPKRSTTGKYISPLVDMAWDAWQGRQQEINADNQDALDAARYRFAKYHITEGYCLPGGFALFDEDTTCWDKTIDAAIQHAVGGDA